MKKKTVAWIVALSLVFLLIGYGIGSLAGDNTEPIDDSIEETEDAEDEETEEVAEDADAVNQSLTAWMPQLNDVIYDYEGIGNEYAAFTWTPQFNMENYYQISKDNSGTVTVEIYEYHEDEIIRIFTRPETYFRENFASISEMVSFEDYEENEVVLKKPIAVGTTWETAAGTYEITSIDKEIEVPAGKYDTIEITFETEDSLIKRYYAENVGLVYEWFESEGLTIESKLEEIQTNTAEIIPINIYQVDDQVMGLDRINAEIQLKTNDPARLALQELFTGETDGFENIYLLPSGTEINYLFLNNEGIVEVDLSSEYVSNMNAGSSGESFYLTGLGNTLSQYYGVERVLLTIDGDNYEGGHIILRDNEYLMYDEDIVNE